MAFESWGRKPGIRLVEQARDLAIDLFGARVMGDQTRDVDTARRAGVRSILLLAGGAVATGSSSALPTTSAGPGAGRGICFIPASEAGHLSISRTPLRSFSRPRLRTCRPITRHRGDAAPSAAIDALV